MKYPTYDVSIYSGGHREFTTPCPFGMQGNYTHDTIMVGSLACQRCIFHKDINQEDHIVSCGIE